MFKKIFIILFVFNASKAVWSQNRPYFSHVKPEVIQDIYVTPDEQTLFVKDRFNVFALDVKTGKRLLRWSLWKQKGSMIDKVNHNTAVIIPQPNNVVDLLGIDTKILGGIGNEKPSNKRFHLYYKIKYYTSATKKWYEGSSNGFKSYDSSGNEIYINASRNIASLKYRNGTTDVLIKDMYQVSLVNENYLLFYKENWDVKDRIPYLYKISSGEIFPIDLKEFHKNYKHFNIIASSCNKNYLYFKIKDSKSSQRKFKPKYYDITKRIFLNEIPNEDKCLNMPTNQFIGETMIWKTIRETVTDSTGTYDATVVAGFDKVTNQRKATIQLTMDIEEQQNYDDGAEQRLEDAIARREERRRNAIAAYKGEEEYTGWAGLLNSGNFRGDGGRRIKTHLRKMHKLNGTLDMVFKEGDFVLFPSGFSSRKITAIDKQNGIMIFGEPGETVKSNDAVHYAPLNMEMCRYIFIKEAVDGKKTCPNCNGSKKAKVKTVTTTEYTSWKTTGQDKYGRAVQERKSYQKNSDIYGKCQVCKGTGSVAAKNYKEVQTYECYQPVK